MRTLSSILVLLLVIATTTVIAQESQTQERKAAPTKKVKVGKLELDKVVFAGYEKAKKEKSNEVESTEVSPDPEGASPQPPEPLTEEELTAAVEQIQRLSSQQEVQTRSLLIYRPDYTQGAMTARQPYTSWGCISTSAGHFNPKQNWIQTGKNGSYAEPFVLDVWGLVQGVYYMLDLSVATIDPYTTSDAPRWLLSGLCTGEVASSSGHLVIGFVAQSTSARLAFRGSTNAYGYFYRATLTRLN